MRHRNGVKKRCPCGPKNWPKCVHEWQFDYKPRGGPRYRFSLDAELGRHLTSKTEAEEQAIRIRSEILAGTFQRATDRHAKAPATQSTVTFRLFGDIWMAVGQVSSQDDLQFLITCNVRAAR
jgi:hypothetical protein